MITVEFVLDEHRVHHPHTCLVLLCEALDLGDGGSYRAEPRPVQPDLHE